MKKLVWVCVTDCRNVTTTEAEIISESNLYFKLKHNSIGKNRVGIVLEDNNEFESVVYLIEVNGDTEKMLGKLKQYLTVKLQDNIIQVQSLTL